jgi:hypothetical protein
MNRRASLPPAPRGGSLSSSLNTESTDADRLSFRLFSPTHPIQTKPRFRFVGRVFRGIIQKLSGGGSVGWDESFDVTTKIQSRR